MTVETGMSGVAELVVGEADTAVALGSGDVPVLGTPRLVALAEQATVAALAGALEPGMTSVGQRVDLEHLAPTAVGEAVRAHAVLEAVDGRRLTFRVTVDDPRGRVGAGTVVRVVVRRERFG